MENQSQKEVAELIAGLVIVALAAKEVVKDGKVDLADLPQLIKLAQQHKDLLNAVQGVGNINVKELDFGLLLAEVVKAIQSVRAA